MHEIITYYQQQGAPADQTALVEMLRQIQWECGDGIPVYAVTEAAESLQVKESFLLAIIERIPSLRLTDTHCLELCGGPNCSKRAQLAAFVEKAYGRKPEGFTLKYVPCMRMCGKGPNIKWDGKLYNGADETLIRALVEKKQETDMLRA